MEAGDTPAAGSGPDKLRLKVVSGNAAGEVIEIEDEFVIGRQATGAGTLGSDIEISREHARIAPAGDGRFAIEDLGSTNGTYVNGRRIEAPTGLETGDKLEMGASALVVQVSALQPTPTGSGTVVPDQAAEAPAVDEPTAEAIAAPPSFALRIDVDLEAGTATVALDEGSDRIELVHEDGRWRIDA